MHRILASSGRILRLLSLSHRFALTSLAVFVLIGLGTAYVLGSAVEHSALRTAQATAVGNLNQRLIRHLTPNDLRGPMIGPREKAFDSIVRNEVISNRLVVVKIWNPLGMVVYSTEPKLIGQTFPLEDSVATALSGREFANVSSLNGAENTDEKGFGRLLQVYVPIRLRGRVVGAFEIYETYGPVAAQIIDLQRTSYLMLGGGLLVLYILLFGIVHAGSNTIQTQQKKLSAYTDQLEQSYRDTITSLAAAVDARDSQTESHSQRVTELALELASHVGFGEEQLRSLQHGALLHDVGKIGVPDGILLKPAGLTAEEWRVMRLHPLIGHEMLKDVSFLRDALPVVRHHHERWDGRGYPDGLAGDRIPIAARIFAIVDAYDAITSDRPYRKGATLPEALARIEDGAGTHFDPVLAMIFIGMMSARLPRAVQQRPSSEPLDSSLAA